MTTTIDRKALSAAIALIKPSISMAQKALPYADAQLPFVNLRLGSGELAIMVPTSKPTKPSDPVPVGAVSVPAETTGAAISILVNGKFLSSIKSLLDKSKRATKVAISVKEGERPAVEYKVGLLKSTKGGPSAYGYGYGSQEYEEIEWVQALPREKGLPYRYSTFGSAIPFSKEEAKRFEKYAKSIDRTFMSQPDLDEPPPPIPATVTVKVNGTQLEDFAQVPEVDLGPVRTTGGFKVPTSDAKAMMEPIASNMSKDTTRQHLSAALFSVGEHGLRMVSTDGHRLMVATLPVETKGEVEIIVPSPLVEFLTKAVSKSKSRTVGFNAKKDMITASVDLGGMTAAIRVPPMDAQFPAYNQIVPRKQDAYVTMTLDVKATMPLANMFSNLKLIWSERFQGLLIGVTPDDEPALSMMGGDLPEYVPAVRLPGTAKIHPGMEPKVVGVNGPYFVDALLGFEDKVKVNIRDELDPILFYGKVGNIDFEAVVMPMRTDGKDQRSIVVKPVARDGTDPMPAADMLAMAKYADYFASPSGSTLPVLETILVKSQMGTLSMTANDLLSAGSTSIPCSGPSFELAINSKDFIKAIRAIDISKNAMLSLAWNNDHEKSPGLLIRDIEGGIQFGITGLAADTFPPVPDRTGKPAGIVSSDALVPLVKGVEATASRDGTRPHLHGVAWRLHKDSWEAITTDGHRATWGRITLPADTGPTLNGRHIMELKAVLGIPKMIDKLTGPTRNIELKVGEKNSSFSIHDTASGLERYMVYNMVDGKSPDFDAVYSSAGNFVTAVSADTKQLQEGATLIYAAEKPTNQPESVAFESAAGKLVLRSLNAKAKTTMPLAFEGQPPSFAVNPEYVVQLCKACSDEELTLYNSGVSRFGTDKASPGPIRCWFTNGPYVHLDWLCMPMKAKDADVGTDAKLGSIRPPMVEDPSAAPLVEVGARKAPKRKPARKQPTKAAAREAVRLNILDRDAFTKLTELEGTAWAKWQRANASEPSTFIDSLEAYKIMSDMLASGELEPKVRDDATGKMRPVMIHDVTGSAGFSGADDEVYVVATDGEILVFGDTLSKAKLAKARKVLRVVGDTSSRTSARRSVERTSAKRSSKKASAKRSSKKAKRRKITFKEARTEILDELTKRGWDVKWNLKKPHATSPDRKLRLLFTSQSVHSIPGHNGRFGNTGHSLWVDIRDFEAPAFARMVVKKFNIQE